MKAVLEQYLKCYFNYNQDNWANLLQFSKVAYNNAMHNSGFTPFKVTMAQDIVAIQKFPQEKP